VDFVRFERERFGELLITPSRSGFAVELDVITYESLCKSLKVFKSIWKSCEAGQPVRSTATEAKPNIEAQPSSGRDRRNGSSKN